MYSCFKEPTKLYVKSEGCNAVFFVEILMFRRDIFLPSSGPKSNFKKKEAEAKWRLHVGPKR
jgi:hypothetical protein